MIEVMKLIRASETSDFHVYLFGIGPSNKVTREDLEELIDAGMDGIYVFLSFIKCSTYLLWWYNSERSYCLYF